MQLTRLTPGDLHPKDNHNIIDNLPELLKSSCNLFSDATEKDVFLYSALGTLSGCLPNYIGSYDGNWVSPHLYVFILAPYGTGKGTMNFARYLAQPIHDAKMTSYRLAMAAYLNSVSAARKKKKGGEEEPEDPGIKKPPMTLLFLPADTSKSAIIDALSDNKGSGIMFESEGDTLTGALKQDYGTFMDIMLKAFHHEAISFMRRKDREHKEVSNPRLALVLSSTYDQFLSLIKSAENGLVSRFAYYLLPENREFKNVFASNKSELKKFLEEYGRTVKQEHDYLDRLDTHLTFHFTDQQQEVFNDQFRAVKKEARGLEGTINRLALITYRIAMILAYFRQCEYHRGQHPEGYIKCPDKDFTNALAISVVLHENAESMHILLPHKRHSGPGNIAALYDELPDEFTTNEAIAAAKAKGISKRKAERFLEKEERLKKVSHGKYKKKQ